MRRVVVVCLVAVLAGAGFGWFIVQSTTVSRSLAAQIQRGPGAVIDFAEVAPFPWDRLYIFGPYSSLEHVENCLDFPWPEYRRTSIEYSDSINLVVFVRQKKAVHWFEYPRGRGELGYLADCSGYAREEARFRVQREGDDRLVLVREEP